MTRAEKKNELIALFVKGAMQIGELIDECFEFGRLIERYYFTFGVGLDKPYRNCYHVIEAEDAKSARDQMFETFGQDWAFQYTEEQWQVSQEKYDRMKNWRTVGEWHEGYTQAELLNLKRI